MSNLTPELEDFFFNEEVSRLRLEFRELQESYKRRVESRVKR